MKQTIFKYPLKVTDLQSVEMPKDAKILDIQLQHGVGCIWALVDPDAEKEKRHFELISLT